MTLAQQFGVALAVNAAVIVALFPTLHLKGPIRPWIVALLGLLSILSPCAISSGHPTVRFLAALVTSGVLVKVYDLGREASVGRIPQLPTYIAFVENSFWHVLRRRPTEGFHDFAGNIRKLAANAIALLVASVVAYEVFRFDWTRLPFAIEHVTKVLTVYCLLVPLANGWAAAWRLLGQPAMDTMRHPLAARTPADFWRRWNRPTQMFLHEHVFLPVGGWRAPIRATLMTFAVSALSRNAI